MILVRVIEINIVAGGISGVSIGLRDYIKNSDSSTVETTTLFKRHPQDDDISYFLRIVMSVSFAIAATSMIALVIISIA